MYKAVKALQDETGDWYLIPLDISDSFLAYLEQGDMEDNYELQEEFEDKFGKYRTGGDLNNIQLYINNED